jgi:hypothetical protein
MKTKNNFLIEKDVERVGNIVSENVKSTSKRIANCSTKPTFTKRKCRYPIVEKTKKDLLIKENEKLISKVSKLQSEIKERTCLYLEIKESYESYLKSSKEFNRNAIMGLLVLAITFLDQIILRLEESGEEQQLNRLFDCLSFLLKHLRDSEDPQEYLSFIDSLKSENLERIQNYMGQTSE